MNEGVTPVESDEEAKAAEAAPAAAPAAPGPAAAHDGLTAVIIEDDTISRTLLRGILRNCGVVVVGESSLGRKGGELVASHEPNIVCLDIGLPDMDGTELLGAIRSRQPTAHVIMVTGVSETERVRAALAGGAVGYIVKPYSESRIRSTLNRLFPGYNFDARR
ncbi:MAG TPA: response regulator [Burkholderiaceae bacterium]|nr:response regulator [Burkholderiaceae bacterium]